MLHRGERDYFYTALRICVREQKNSIPRYLASKNNSEIMVLSHFFLHLVAFYAATLRLIAKR